MTSRRAAAFALTCGLACAGCGKDLPDCTVEDYVGNDVGTEETTDCGTFAFEDPALSQMAMVAAQTCVITAAAAPESFRFVYDQILAREDPDTMAIRLETTRVGWVGTVDSGTLAIEQYTQPVAADGTLGALSVQTCDAIQGAYYDLDMYASPNFYGWVVHDGACNPTAPTKTALRDPSYFKTPGPIYDACLVCVNPSPIAAVCR